MFIEISKLVLVAISLCTVVVIAEGFIINNTHPRALRSTCAYCLKECNLDAQCVQGCISGWLLGEDQFCEKPDCSHCAKGVCNEKGDCEKCEEGWKGWRCQQHACDKCEDKKQCRDGVCSKCKAGWLLGSVGDCSQPDCSNCDEQQCDVSNGEGIGCSRCKPGWLLGEDMLCRQRDCSRCKLNKCEADNKCKACAPGFNLGKDNMCLEPDCRFCEGGKCDPTTGMCYKGCIKGWLPGRNHDCRERDCTRCLNDVCTEVGICKACKRGFHLGGGSTCSEFEYSRCKGEVDKEDGTCTECAPGWTHGPYHRCGQRDCSNCKYGICNKTEHCQACRPGWLLGKDFICNTPDCRNCKSGECVDVEGVQVCEHCRGGFAKGDSQRCSIPCPPNCYACEDGKVCNKCKGGYQLKGVNGTCIAAKKRKSNPSTQMKKDLALGFVCGALLALIAAVYNIVTGTESMRLSEAALKEGAGSKAELTSHQDGADDRSNAELQDPNTAEDGEQLEAISLVTDGVGQLAEDDIAILGVVDTMTNTGGVDVGATPSLPIEKSSQTNAAPLEIPISDASASKENVTDLSNEVD